MKKYKVRYVQDKEVYVTKDLHLFIEDRVTGEKHELTHKFMGTIPEQSLDVVEQRIRSNELDLSSDNSGELLEFLKK